MAPAKNTSKTSPRSSPAKRLRDAQENLLRGDQGDLTIQCVEKTWKCSAVILAQRCDFFRVATSGSFMESKTKIVKLHDETVTEVDMLLMHLYTLYDPDFKSHETFKHPNVAAESAIKLGDKYDLPDLRAAGQQYLSQLFKDHLRDWSAKPEDSKQRWIRRLRRLWAMDCSGVDIVWEVVVERLVAVARDIIEYEPFQKVCEDYPDFALQFMRAQAKAADLPKDCPRPRPINTLRGGAASDPVKGQSMGAIISSLYVKPVDTSNGRTSRRTK